MIMLPDSGQNLPCNGSAVLSIELADWAERAEQCCRLPVVPPGELGAGTQMSIGFVCTETSQKNFTTLESENRPFENICYTIIQCK